MSLSLDIFKCAKDAQVVKIWLSYLLPVTLPPVTLPIALKGDERIFPGVRDLYLDLYSELRTRTFIDQ